MPELTSDQIANRIGELEYKRRTLFGLGGNNTQAEVDAMSLELAELKDTLRACQRKGEYVRAK